MKHFETLGFVSSNRKFNASRREGMASQQQLNFIRGLWGDYTEGQGTDLSLGRWLERSFKVSSIRFLDRSSASRAIDALKAMNMRK